MFSGKLITITFLLMFGGTYLGMLAEKLKQQWLVYFGQGITAIASLYCVAGATFLWGDWQDPFASANASSEQIGRAAATHGGRGGIVLLAIKFWPYVLGGLGACFAYFSIDALRLDVLSAKWRRLNKAIDEEAASLQAAHDLLGKTLEDSAAMMDSLADEFSDNKDIANRFREIAKDARKPQSVERVIHKKRPFLASSPPGLLR